MIYEEDGVYISAELITLGKDVSFGKNVDIRCIDEFSLGDRSHLGTNVQIRGRSVRIGADLHHSRGLDVGGGGCDRPRSTLVIGDRCTIHNNHINLAEGVLIGHDVGLSPEVVIETHGFWLNVIWGFPTSFAPVTIRSGSIIGYRTIIMMGVTIGEKCVVGAQSVVTRNLDGNSVYAGSPAKKLRDIHPLPPEKKLELFDHIIDEFVEIATYHNFLVATESFYPRVRVNHCLFNVETLEWGGTEDEATDSWRDHARRYGLRFYSERPFRSALRWE